MDGIQAVNSSSWLSALLTSQAVASSEQTLFASTGIPGSQDAASASFFVAFSTLGQTLAATSRFQDQMVAIQNGGSALGTNFGNDLPSLTAAAQRLADAFNGLQSTLAGIQGSALFRGNDVARTLTTSLDALAQSSFANGTSELTRLSQIGIDFRPDAGGKGSTLSIDLKALSSAFASDPAGAFSLLDNAASAFGDLAATTTAPSNNGAGTLAQLIGQTDGGSLLFGGASSASLGLVELLALGNLGQSNDTTPSLQQSLIALSEFATVSQLLG